MFACAIACFVPSLASHRYVALTSPLLRGTEDRRLKENFKYRQLFIIPIIMGSELALKQNIS